MSLNAFAASAVDVVGNEICGTRKSHIKGRKLFMKCYSRDPKTTYFILMDNKKLAGILNIGSVHDRQFLRWIVL